MKNFNRILALLVTVLLLFGATSAFAEAKVALDAPQDLDVPDLDIDVPDLGVDGLDLDIASEVIELSDDLPLVEEAPEAADTVSNADEEAPRIYEYAYTMRVGEKKRVLPATYVYQFGNIIKMTSSDPTIARATGGIIIALASGRCLVTATIGRIPYLPYSHPKVYKYDITVVGGPVLSETEKTLNINETFQLSVSDLGKLSITSWSSSDPGVATVDDGKVTAVGEGQCVISVELSNGGVLKCRVEVKDDGGLTCNSVTLTLRKLSTVRLKDPRLRKVTWSCSDPRIVKIKTKGSICLIIARKKGECTITARVKGGETYTCRVTVE